MGREDTARVLAWRNDPDIARWMYTDHRITPEEHAAWFERALVDATRVDWIVEWHARPVGVVNLAAIDARHRRCEWGIYVGDDSARGTGAADGAVFLSLDHAFGPLGMERVTCEAMAGNGRALRLYERCGFRREGHLRAHVRRGGEAIDVVALAILRSEWELLRPGLHSWLCDRHVLGRHSNA